LADAFSGCLAAEAARVPQLEADLRAARAQCAESEEAGRSAAAKLKVADGELGRLRRLEENHLKELALLRTAEKEKVDDLSKRLTEVEKQRLALQEEVTTKTAELSATAKRWVEEIGSLDCGLAGKPFIFLSSSPLPAFGCRLPA
jgi:chromosome segregation ATPase